MFDVLLVLTLAEYKALRTVLPVKPNERHFRSLFCHNFASETPTEFIFSQLVDFANVILSNA